MRPRGPPPPRLVKDANICSTMAALMGNAEKDCWFRSSTVREFTLRFLAGELPLFGELALPPVLALVFLPLLAVAALVRLPLRTGAGGVSAATLSMVRNRALQHGHLFSVSAHRSMQSKQKRWVHPLMEATSVMVGGASRQMAQVKSSGGFSPPLLAAEADVAAIAMDFPDGLAAGLRSMSSSSSSSLRTMGVSLDPRAAAERDGFLRGDDDAATARLPLPPLAVLTIAAEAVGVEAAKAVSALRRVERLGAADTAAAAARRVERGLVVKAEAASAAVGVLDPTENEATVPMSLYVSRKERVTRGWEEAICLGGLGDVGSTEREQIDVFDRWWFRF